METVDNRSFKEKVDAFKWNAKEKIGKGWNATKKWCSENKEILIVAIPAVLAASAKIVKSVDNMQDRQYEYKERYLQVWDPATRQHVKLRRELKPHEQLELSQRNQDGERLTDILFDMGVAKRK